MNPTLAPRLMTNIKKCVVVIAAKYISASLPTVSRMLGTFIPRFVDFMSRIFVRIITKTAMSEAGELEERGCRGVGIHTKGKSEAHLNECTGLYDAGRTHVIHTQTKRRRIWHYCNLSLVPGLECV